METYEARALATALMAEHGLVEQGWTLTLDINAGLLASLKWSRTPSSLALSIPRNLPCCARLC